MASRDLRDLNIRLIGVWLHAARTFSDMYPKLPKPFITCTYRSPEEQLELYAQGRTKPGKIVTQLKSGSKHNKKPAEAFDIAFKDKNGKLDWSADLFKKFADIVKAADRDIRWGGDWQSFKDRPHFEM
jgi:peptidoglycan L-alanyl-D-glutamate endopeptidase CwlK